jgi:hypothetical protein
MHAHTHTSTHTHARVCVHTHTQTCTHTCTCVRAHTHTNTHVHARMHAHTHTHTHTAFVLMWSDISIIVLLISLPVLLCASTLSIVAVNKSPCVAMRIYLVHSCMISGFSCKVAENCTVLGYCAAKVQLLSVIDFYQMIHSTIRRVINRSIQNL